MKSEELLALTRRLMRHATAPYFEAAVRAEAEAILAENAIPFERDQFGNLLAKYSSGSFPRSLAFCAHMDHPGFEVVRKNEEDR